MAVVTLIVTGIAALAPLSNCREGGEVDHYTEGILAHDLGHVTSCGIIISPPNLLDPSCNSLCFEHPLIILLVMLCSEESGEK